MPYFFFKEQPDHPRWVLIFQTDSFNDAKSEQRRLRGEEKVDGRVIQVVCAPSEAEAQDELKRTFNYSEIMREKPVGKHS